MIELFEAMIALQREQMKAGERLMAAGRDLLAAQERQADAIRAQQKAVKSWLSLWGVG